MSPFKAVLFYYYLYIFIVFRCKHVLWYFNHHNVSYLYCAVFSKKVLLYEHVLISVLSVPPPLPPKNIPVTPPGRSSSSVESSGMYWHFQFSIQNHVVSISWKNRVPDRSVLLQNTSQLYVCGRGVRYQQKLYWYFHYILYILCSGEIFATLKWFPGTSLSL